MSQMVQITKQIKSQNLRCIIFKSQKGKDEEKKNLKGDKEKEILYIEKKDEGYIKYLNINSESKI